MRRGLIRVFRCPNCSQVIQTTVASCRYCAAAIDPVAAEAAADLDEQIRAANFEVEMTLDRLPKEPDWLFVVGAPFFFLRWWIRTRRFPQDHPELVASKRSIVPALILWIPLLIVLILLIFG